MAVTRKRRTIFISIIVSRAKNAQIHPRMYFFTLWLYNPRVIFWAGLGECALWRMRDMEAFAQAKIFTRVLIYIGTGFMCAQSTTYSSACSAVRCRMD